MKTFYSLLAALIAVSGFGFGQGLATAQVSITEVSSSNSFGEDWFELCLLYTSPSPRDRG